MDQLAHIFNLNVKPSLLCPFWLTWIWSQTSKTGTSAHFSNTEWECCRFVGFNNFSTAAKSPINFSAPSRSMWRVCAFATSSFSLLFALLRVAASPAAAQSSGCNRARIKFDHSCGFTRRARHPHYRIQWFSNDTVIQILNRRINLVASVCFTKALIHPERKIGSPNLKMHSCKEKVSVNADNEKHKLTA